MKSSGEILISSSEVKVLDEISSPGVLGVVALAEAVVVELDSDAPAPEAEV